MTCTCRGAGAGVVIVGESGVKVTGAGTQAKPFRVSTSLADSLVFEVRDSSTVNLTITGSGSVEDPYILRAETGSVTSLTSLADVRSDAPIPGAVPTWVAAAGSLPGHWEFQVPNIPDALTSVATSLLTGTVEDDQLPDRIQQHPGLLGVGYDLNNLTTTGWYRGTQMVHMPPVPNTTGWWWINSMSHDAAGAWLVQVAYSYTTVGNPAGEQVSYIRRRVSGTWGNWYRQYSEQDIAAGALDTYFPRKGVLKSVSQTMLPFADVSGNTGVVVTTASSGGFTGTKAVVFPTGRFIEDPPQVQLTAEDSTPGALKVSIVPGSVTLTGFSIYVWRTTSSSSFKVNYYARDSRNS